MLYERKKAVGDMCMGCVLVYFRGMSGIKYAQDLWSKMPVREGMCLESCVYDKGQLQGKPLARETM